MSVATLKENTYPQLIKEFYKNMVITLRADGISCLLKNTWIDITKNLIRTILSLRNVTTKPFYMKHILFLKDIILPWLAVELRERTLITSPS